MRLGQTETTGPAGRRDAFHAPAVLVSSSEVLIYPGCSVRFVDDTFTTVQLSTIANRHAVVDPFAKVIRPGELFWVLLEPELVGELTHHFDIRADDVLEQRPAGIPNEESDYDRADRIRCDAEGCS